MKTYHKGYVDTVGRTITRHDYRRLDWNQVKVQTHHKGYVDAVDRPITRHDDCSLMD